MVTSSLTAAPIAVDALDKEFARGDIEFQGVDHSGVSYVAHVFLNNPVADTLTELTPEQGYAGTFHIFGHGGCFGDVGHCDVRERRLYDPRPAHPLTPARKTVIATDALKRAIAGSREITVTVAAFIAGVTVRTSALEDFLHFERVRIVTYR